MKYPKEYSLEVAFTNNVNLGIFNFSLDLSRFKKSIKIKKEKIETFPAWIISFPLMICAVSWIILGFASLIKEEYWEHRVCPYFD